MRQSLRDAAEAVPQGPVRQADRTGQPAEQIGHFSTQEENVFRLSAEKPLNGERKWGTCNWHIECKGQGGGRAGRLQ
jgi:hypothetical protein